jgi:carbon storage regulator
MLILTRKKDETILIGENISIKVVEIRGKQVRLGIEAPADTLILRGEMKIQERDEPVETETKAYPVDIK